MTTQRGRPSHVPTEKDRKTVEAMASYGVPQDEIALVLGVSPPTLRRHYAETAGQGADWGDDLGPGRAGARHRAQQQLGSRRASPCARYAPFGSATTPTSKPHALPPKSTMRRKYGPDFRFGEFEAQLDAPLAAQAGGVEHHRRVSRSRSNGQGALKLDFPQFRDGKGLI